LEQFYNLQYDLDATSNQKILNVFDSFETLSKTTTAFMLQERAANNKMYPSGFVTIPNAENIFATAREESGASILTYSPTVYGKDYDLWTTYVEKNLNWLEESWSVYPNIYHELSDTANITEIETQIWRVQSLDSEGHEIHFDASVCNDDQDDIPKKLGSVIEDPAGNKIFSPVWLVSPPPNPQNQARINFNLMSLDVFRLVTDTVASYRDSTIHDVCKFNQVR
jgi:hypothetical protein